MIVNWLMLGVVVVLGALFLVLLGRRQQAKQVSRLAVNKELYRQRQQELEQEATEGLLSNVALASAQRELDKRFLDDTAEIEQEVNQSSRTNLWLPAFGIVVITLAVYLSGSSWRLQLQADNALQQLPELGKKILQGSAEVPTQDELDTFALGLRQKLVAEPGDAVAWLVYGRTLVAMNQTEQAIAAMDKSYRLDPNRMGTLVSYSQLLLSTGDDQYLRQASGMLAQALEIQPTNIDALSLLGFVAYSRGDWEQAVSAWQLLLEQLGEDDPRATPVTQALADAQSRLGAADQTLTVSIDISAELREQVSEGATLFVFLRAPATEGGPQMPAAVVRQKVDEFPVEVQLSDANAMLSDYTMSTLSQWEVLARISDDEQIDAQAGDLNAPPKLVNADFDQRIELVISEREN